MLSIVIPCYNEEDCLHVLRERVFGACAELPGWSFELILIDDGSKDTTPQILRQMAESYPEVVAVLLSRNHGHQLALSAGLSVAQGERILILDADLQDPPELLGPMMARMDDGVDVVYGQRKKRDGETLFKKLTATLFYRLINALSDVPIPMDTGDFRLMSRRALDVLQSMPENHRFIRGMVSWIGYRQEPFLYDRDARYAGTTHYPFFKMLAFALDAITSFSIRPLKLASWFGGFFLLWAVGAFVWAFWTGWTQSGEPGWASLIAVILFCASAQMVVLGLIGEYLGRMYIEVKRRPLYIIEQVIGKTPPDQA